MLSLDILPDSLTSDLARLSSSVFPKKGKTELLPLILRQLGYHGLVQALDPLGFATPLFRRLALSGS